MILIYPHTVGFQLALELLQVLFILLPDILMVGIKQFLVYMQTKVLKKFSAGLFGHVSGIEIKNVIIKDGYVKTEVDSNSQDAAGLLIGSAAQGYGLSTTVSNCHVSGTIESGSALTGGLAGYNSYGTYKDCSTDIMIHGHGCSGGFIGSDFSGSYENCTANGKCVWSMERWRICREILFYNSEAKHCVADVKITANDWNAGGFVGYIEENVTIHNCISYGGCTQ